MSAVRNNTKTNRSAHPTGKKKSNNTTSPSIRRTKRIYIAGVVCGLLVVLACYVFGTYGWYQWSNRGTPFRLGMSFSADYARSLGVEPRETYRAMLDDLGIRQLRLMSYWNRIEPEKGRFDFAELDWQMNEAAKRGAKVNLSIGLRQPRWPECHPPKWLDTSAPWDEWRSDMESYLTAVVTRYRTHPALETYQLENEIYNRVFGECKNHDRFRLADEKHLVNNLDFAHPVIISRSDNSGIPTVRQPRGDINGMSLYRHVWVRKPINRYFTYPLPPFHYGFTAGQQKLLFGEESMIHELQTEPWPAGGRFVTQVPMAEQDKTFNAEILRQNVAFAKQTGIRHIDLWGAEYWYWRWKVYGDPSVWQTARDIYRQ